MKKRNPILVVVFSILTFGIYYYYWLVSTKKSLNKSTQLKIPTVWLIIIPIIVTIIASILVVTFTKHATSTSGASASAGGAAGLVIVDFIAAILIVPATFYWFWKYSKAVEQYTNKEMTTATTFLLMWILNSIGAAIIQDKFNSIEAKNSVQQPQPNQAPALPNNNQVPPFVTSPVANAAALDQQQPVNQVNNDLLEKTITPDEALNETVVPALPAEPAPVLTTSASTTNPVTPSAPPNQSTESLPAQVIDTTTNTPSAPPSNPQ